MNFQSAVNHINMLAGGSIPGQDLLDSSQIWGVTIAGLGIVFACLVLLVLVIFLFGKIFEGINKKKADKQAAKVAASAPKAVPKPAAAPAASAPAASAPAASDDDEVIAVISAVIAAMSAADGTTYKVRSVKPAASNSLGGRTAWAMDGRRNNVMPF
ncbi:MAG: OadG family protein [Oscillospiraceae bacterium]|nr:OadG family protein [Oscillospiraceae bacterium]